MSPNNKTNTIKGPVDLEALVRSQREAQADYKGSLMVCTGTGCVAAKAFDVRDDLEKELKERGLDKDYQVVATGCNGFCAAGPIVVTQPEGTFYQKVDAAGVTRIIEEDLLGEPGAVVESLTYEDPVRGGRTARMDDIPFFKGQELIALRNKGLIDPEDILSAIERGAYGALSKALTSMAPEAVANEVAASGLRGRGGAGFPAGVKWKSCMKAVAERGELPFVVCNADEGDPGAFMDRSIVETDPHTVLEGMLLGAYAIGAKQGYVYIRKEYPLALQRLEIAIAQARERGLLGANILGSGFSFELGVHRGAGAFVCGESTALMASMAGKVGEPRAKYVRSVEYGYKDKPTVLNNVETWAAVPVIIEKGAAWFASIGTGTPEGIAADPWSGSAGTKVFSLVGDVRNTGLVEVPMGISLRTIIDDIGGGVPEGRQFKAVQTGGPSGGCIPASMLDMAVDFDSLAEVGSMMGSGGMIVMDDHTCMVDVARYFVSFLADESCGKCTPCREGLIALRETLTRICEGKGREEDLAFLEDASATIAATSLCQLGATAPNPVLSTLRYFREEYEEHIRDHKCMAGICKSLIEYRINEACTGCTICAKRCPTQAITGEKKGLHIIDAEACVACGICAEVCRFDAVEVI
jgi:NADH:ubiquinone oxidoreductase subunit F (NADH-binding)/(2Fe-2S) ferredoxin/NAD-dependent dihydropyrimidine dehydrogenase PreA subunit